MLPSSRATTYRLVWGAFDAKGKCIAAFRVTAENEFADENDRPASLAKAKSVGILHPLAMSSSALAAWGERLSDYEIAAPFPQLGRQTYALEKGEGKSTELTRFHGLELPAPTLVFTLEKLGWTRGPALDSGCFDRHLKQFPAANLTAFVWYAGEVWMSEINPEDSLTIECCQFMSGLRQPIDESFDKVTSPKLAAVPPVVISEVIADLQLLRSKAN